MAEKGRRDLTESVPLPEFYMVYGEQELGAPTAPGVSAVEHLMNEFEAHQAQEGEFIRRYREIAGRSKSPLIKFLLELIISDEEKHHAVIHAMASTLRGSLHWTKPEDSLLALGEGSDGEQELLKLTEDFIAHERQGIRRCKQLMKPSRGYYYGLFALLLESIAHDSQKHVKILSFLRQRLKEA